MILNLEDKEAMILNLEDKEGLQLHTPQSYLGYQQHTLCYTCTFTIQPKSLFPHHTEYMYFKWRTSRVAGFVLRGIVCGKNILCDGVCQALHHRECARLTLEDYKKLGASTEKWSRGNCVESEQDLNLNEGWRMGVEVMGGGELERNS